jgi:hypothetical protein
MSLESRPCKAYTDKALLAVTLRISRTCIYYFKLSELDFDFNQSRLAVLEGGVPYTAGI